MSSMRTRAKSILGRSRPLIETEHATPANLIPPPPRPGTPSTRPGMPGELPIGFVRDILAAAHQAGVTSGLYIGCGNGRNYLPLIAGGLDLTGLDISVTAITQLATPAPPDRRDRLIHGDLRCPARHRRPTRPSSASRSSSTATAPPRMHTSAPPGSASRPAACSACGSTTATDVRPRHEVTEHHPDGGFTVRYLAGLSRACPSTSSPSPNWTGCSPRIHARPAAAVARRPTVTRPVVAVGSDLARQRPSVACPHASCPGRPGTSCSGNIASGTPVTDVD